ncbi:MAG: aldolase catalytic domain-containing protein [Lachnospiraceae bacterium]|nr:aldolase catalytic domain-containing protein [Lachnospiraceae bacterium]
MGKIYLLDCTLRDGGYVNDWRFGCDTIKGFSRKIAQTGIEFFEIGFIKGDKYDPDRSVFPDIESIAPMIAPKDPHMKYVGMLDMSAPIPIERLTPCDGTSVDGIRVIFKKDRTDEAYRYCERIKELGYFFTVNVVGTDLYTDAEFIEVIDRFNRLLPFAFSIVDTFGLIKRKQFLRLAYLADNNLADGIVLAYHAHNNLQQAYGNAESLVEMNLNRDLLIDACVFGMGRGAGNLNLEVFAEFMNENYGTNYKIEPMLEIMDEYLNDIYKTRFWGYSVPLYLSATTGSHPNYAIYLAEKNTLTVKAFNELLQSIPAEDKVRFSKEKAEQYYRAYQENYVDDREAVEELAGALAGRDIMVLAPGRSLALQRDEVRGMIGEDTVVIAANFLAGEFDPDYIFSSNMRRFARIQGHTGARCIITSNMKEAEQKNYVVNFSTYASRNPDIIDNSALMLLRLLAAAGVKKVRVAGMDGYSEYSSAVYFNSELAYDFSAKATTRNSQISEELRALSDRLVIEFVTPTVYEV